jgi:hypothetical protein
MYEYLSGNLLSICLPSASGMDVLSESLDVRLETALFRFSLSTWSVSGGEGATSFHFKVTTLQHHNSSLTESPAVHS